jgi:hypothetical protein
LGWKDKLLDFTIPDSSPATSYEAVLDSLAGFVRCSNACAHYQKVAASQGVQFRFGQELGAVDSLVKEPSTTEPEKAKVIGLKTKDGVIHKADVVVVAGKEHQCFKTAYDIMILTANSRVLFHADSSRLELPPRILCRKLSYLQD